MIQLTGTAACTMRDELVKNRFAKKITLKGITDKMCDIELPEWLQSQILQMVSYRQYERITCPVEQAMASAVYYKIVCQIKAENPTL